ncbi:hypothetical protein [Oceanirhabdus seepicola]|uniref:Uncharacterized protein n=1 Tax=Oceanirhabdus seepicola TaxID=2828781 RepID=A0A9J6NZU3_9CLOT|nr:hypothetical protein [Oceanirhabdus seepicola]MCM1989133.1 hypothetical protein [Oceanirhabdus seepicola]
MKNNEKLTTNILSGVFFIIFIILFLLRLSGIAMDGIGDIAISLASFGVFLAFIFSQRKKYYNKLIIVLVIVVGILGSFAFIVVFGNLPDKALLFITLGIVVISVITIIILGTLTIIRMLKLYKNRL